ncbi:MAG: aminopeptidase [Actinobacteria bacterium]|nr:aminopeptidase [Actinomycetota bacterium]
MDDRIKKLAEILICYSCNIKKGEKALIQCYGSTAFPLVRELIKKIYEVGGIPFVSLKDDRIIREIIKSCTKKQLALMTDYEMKRMKGMDAFIGIRAHDNVNEFGDLPVEKINLHTREFSSIVSEERVENTKWVVLRWPNDSMAQLANTSLEAFEDFYFDVCTIDYSKMSKAMDSLVKLMEKTDKVRIKGPKTDLVFSIKEIHAIKAAGESNIPDGEVFTAPVRDSAEGFITYNTPAVFQGFTYENIYFEFKKGRIIKASANDSDKIKKILDMDEGARYLGEFAIGLNPYIIRAIKDPLFDEKIMGSIHLTPGRCYKEASNGNHSSIHWDLVLIQTPEFGGGEIYFDGNLIRKDGRFIIKELECLNPENLK